MPYKAILFDLDGVLVNMPAGHYQALNKALGHFGVEIGEEEHQRVFNGLPTRKKIEILETQNRLPRGLGELVNSIKQKYTKEIMASYCAPEHEKILMLHHLKNWGYKLGCCSNSVRETLDLMLTSSNLLGYFDLVLGNDDVKNPKPDPEIYLEAFKRLSVSPEESVIVEDAPHGIAAAIASGARVLEVRGVEDVNLGLFKDVLNLQI